jgi:Acetokinase family
MNRERRTLWRCSVIRQKSGSVPSPPRSAVWIRSYSPEGLARTPHLSARICDGLGFLGIELSESRNAQSAEAAAAVISTDASRTAVRVIRTDEHLMIARSVDRILNTGAVNKKD